MGRSRRDKHLSGDREEDSGSDSSKSRSRSRSASSGSAKSRSGSPRSKTGSRSPARSRSGSGSRSGKSRSVSRSRSGSGSPARAKSGSRSRSRSRSKSRSRSASRSKKGSDSEAEGESGKKRQLSGDEDEDGSKKAKDGSKSPTEDVGAEDLFGDDLSVSSEDESDKVAKKKVIDSDGGDSVARYDDDDGASKRFGKQAVIGSDSDDDDKDKKERETKRYDDKPEEEPVPETRIDVEVPKINTDLGKEVHFVKLPNFLSMESRPFDPKTYEDEMDEDQSQQDEEGRTRLKLKVENTIRWRQRFDKDLNVVRESNARMVKWSDGSYSLHLGNEIFDVHKQPLQSDFNHLFIRQGTGLQGQAVFKTKLSFRPHSVDSHTHKKMTLSMADRSTKSNQIKVISHVGNNPEEGRWEKIRKEEQDLRMAMRTVSSKNRSKEKGARKGLSGGYLEEGGDDSGDDAAFDIAAIKAKFKHGARDKKPIYSSDEDGSDVESKKGKRLQKAKGMDSDSDSNRYLLQ